MTDLQYLQHIKKIDFCAYKLARKYFDDKVDKGGNNYLNHLVSVADLAESKAYQEYKFDGYKKEAATRKVYIVGILHDILEDTTCTEQELRDIGCDDEIIDAIKSVTRKSEETDYFDFIKRASKNEIGRIVKIADLENNMDIRRLKTLGDYELKRLKKYWYSWMFLRGAITEDEVNKNIRN